MPVLRRAYPDLFDISNNIVVSSSVLLENVAPVVASDQRVAGVPIAPGLACRLIAILVLDASGRVYQKLTDRTGQQA
jgi:hypothetical protein